MEASTVAPAAIVSAISLSVFTLGIFAIQQNYGPDSAVRRFEAAVRAKDWRALQTTVFDPVDSFPVGYLVETIQRIQASGASLHTVRTNREGKSASVQTSIDLPDGQAISMVWQVSRQGGAWRVDAAGTLNFMNR